MRGGAIASTEHWCYGCCAFDWRRQEPRPQKQRGAYHFRWQEWGWADLMGSQHRPRRERRIIIYIIKNQIHRYHINRPDFHQIGKSQHQIDQTSPSRSGRSAGQQIGQIVTRMVSSDPSDQQTAPPLPWLESDLARTRNFATTARGYISGRHPPALDFQGGKN